MKTEIGKQIQSFIKEFDRLHKEQSKGVISVGKFVNYNGEMLDVTEYMIKRISEYTGK